MIGPLKKPSKRDTRDALRFALQSAVAASSTFAIMQGFGLPEQFVGVLSAVYVVQPSMGAALSTGWSRTISTVVGCLIGFVALITLPSGWGTMAALGLSMLLMNGIAGLIPEWRYGVVAAVALSLGSEENAMEASYDRTLAIGLGVGVGLLASVVIWPRRATTRAKRNVDVALRALADYVASVVETLRTEGVNETDEALKSYQAELALAQESADVVRLTSDEDVRNRIHAARRLFHSVVILDRITGESDNLAASNEELGEHLEQVSRSTRRILDGLAEGQHDQGAELEKIRSSIKALRDTEAPLDSQREGRSKAEILYSSLAFGVNEIEDSLTRLVKLYQGKSLEDCVKHKPPPREGDSSPGRSSD